MTTDLFIQINGFTIIFADNDNVILAKCDCTNAKIIICSAITNLLSVLFHSLKEKFFAGAENTTHGTAKTDIAPVMLVFIDATNTCEAAQMYYAGGMFMLWAANWELATAKELSDMATSHVANILKTYEKNKWFSDNFYGVGV